MWPPPVLGYMVWRINVRRRCLNAGLTTQGVIGAGGEAGLSEIRA